MKLRKINAVLSLFTTVLLMDHAMFFSVWMLSRCSIEKSANYMPRILATLMIVHAIISIIFGIVSQKGEEKRKCKTYFKMNKSTYIQRITGILMIILLGIHVAGAMNHFQPHILHGIVQPVFFATALLHVSVSTSKALITLGMGNATVVRIVDVIMKVLCTATFIAGVIGFYLCIFVGVAR